MCVFLSVPRVRQQQHWASLCVCELSCARGPGVPSFLPTDTQKHCCHSSHLWINEVLSSQVCSGTGKCGAKACSVAQLQVSELLLNSRPVPWLGGGADRLVTWTHWSHINHSVYCWKFSNLQAAVRALGSSGALPLKGVNGSQWTQVFLRMAKLLWMLPLPNLLHRNSAT